MDALATAPQGPSALSEDGAWVSHWVSAAEPASGSWGSGAVGTLTTLSPDGGVCARSSGALRPSTSVLPVGRHSVTGVRDREARPSRCT